MLIGRSLLVDPLSEVDRSATADRTRQASTQGAEWGSVQGSLTRRERLAQRRRIERPGNAQGARESAAALGESQTLRTSVQVGSAARLKAVGIGQQDAAPCHYAEQVRRRGSLSAADAGPDGHARLTYDRRSARPV